MKETEVKHNIGLRIKKYRTKAKLTQFKLGELIDINQRQVALIEAGKSYPSLSTLLKISKVFDCELKDFYKFNHVLCIEDLRNIIKMKIDKADYKTCQSLLTVIDAFLDL